MLKRIIKWYDLILKGTVVAVVGALVLVCFLQVICRFCFNNSLSWSEEFCKIMFCMNVFLASALCVNEKKHITIDILTQFLPRHILRYLMLFSDFVCLIFFVFLAISGYSLMINNFHQVTAALKWNMGCIYMVIPVGSICMAINCVRIGIENFFITYAPQREKED